MNKPISDYLINHCGFTKLRKRHNDEEVDVDLYDCVKRIGEIHYLFFSETMKYFDLGVKYSKPKGKAGGGFDEFKKVMIPKLIRTKEDAVALINSIS